MRKRIEKAIKENRINPVPPCTKEQALKIFKKSNLLFGSEMDELLLQSIPLISAGYVREKIEKYTHEEMLLQAKKLVAEAGELSLAEGFIYGITHKNCREYILPFVAYHFFKKFPVHEKIPHYYGIEKKLIPFYCGVCEYEDNTSSKKDNDVYSDFNESFLEASFLYQARTFITYSVNHALYCLEEGINFPKVCPSKEDFLALISAIRLAENIPSTKKIGAYKQALHTSKILPLTSDETQEFINVLSYLNILHPKDLFGFAEKYTPRSERAESIEHKNDYAYPVCLWRGADGVDYEMIEKLFGKLECYQA